MSRVQATDRGMTGAQRADGRASGAQAADDGVSEAQPTNVRASESLPPDGLVTLPLAEALPSCALDADGMREQGARYAELGRHVDAFEREPGSLTVRFDDGVEDRLLHETIEVERGCCSFFGIDLDGRTLRMTVGDPAHDPALDAIAGALGLAV